jgi:hypothetical protein
MRTKRRFQAWWRRGVHVYAASFACLIYAVGAIAAPSDLEGLDATQVSATHPGLLILKASKSVAFR